MDAVFIDQAGHKKNFLYQYDVGQSFVVENFEYSTTPKVQFQIKSLKTSPSVSSRLTDGNLVVLIPDMLLTYGEDIVAYLYIKDAIQGNIIETVFISVIPRKRPADYQYTSEIFARTINGTTLSENPSFGEVMIWADENPKNEQRCGYFVTASYGASSLMINKANSIDNVYGVTANKVGFASNCTDNKLDVAGNLLPKYEYVCTSGFVEVVDKGRCYVGEKCVPYNDGTATRATGTVGYKVVARTDTQHIIIFVDTSMQTINGLQTNINTVSTNLSNHKSDTKNPHSVTKTQVGLSEVPNVATNDQTPTYTESSTLEKLLSGEKLSTAFGKLSKAVTDLISHIANKSNPHSVTKAQVDLGNCDNTSDVDKPVSTAQATAIADAKKAGTDAQNTVDTHVARTDNPHGVTKAQVGLNNVDNTSDANKPISTATQTALNSKADLVDGVVPLSQLPSQVKEMRVVDDIATRDAITDKFANLRVYVKDATADSTVKSGGADYLYDGTTWIKTGEAESLDLVLSWDNVSGAPTDYTPSAHASTHAIGGSDEIRPSDIGAATSDHTHDASVVPIIDETTGTKYYFKMINGTFGLYAENSDVNVLNGDNTSY